VIEAQRVVPERKVPHCQRFDATLTHDRVTQVGAKGEVLNGFLAMPEQPPDIAGFE
jgi:hypothetical protein